MPNERFRRVRRAGVRCARASRFWTACFCPSRWIRYYAARREHGTCDHAGVHSRRRKPAFCTHFGIDAAQPAGDVATWIGGDSLYLRANTEKGEALLERARGRFGRDADDAGNAAQDNPARLPEKLPLTDSSNLTGFDGEHLTSMFELPSGGSLFRACLGCGTCTFVCPTCQCYDIRDFDTGQRHSALPLLGFSCMYSDFTHDGARQRRDRRRWSASASGLCTSLCIFRRTTMGFIPASAAADALQKCPHVA